MPIIHGKDGKFVGNGGRSKTHSSLSKVKAIKAARAGLQHGMNAQKEFHGKTAASNATQKAFSREMAGAAAKAGKGAISTRINIHNTFGTKSGSSNMKSAMNKFRQAKNSLAKMRGK